MTMKRLILVSALALALGACQTTRPTGAPSMTEAEQIALGCQAAQLSVVVLTGFDAELARKLTEPQLRAIRAAETSVLSICASPPQTLDELKQRGFAEAAALLSRELAAYMAARDAKP